MNDYVRPHCLPWVGTNKEAAGNQFVLAPSIIFAAPNISGGTTRRTYRRAQISSSTSPIPGIFSYTRMASESDRPITYFDISIGDQPIGRVIFSLYADLVPKTAENFRGYPMISGGFPCLTKMCSRCFVHRREGSWGVGKASALCGQHLPSSDQIVSERHTPQIPLL